MGFGWAAANANIQVLLQEGGGGGTLGKAMALHMAAVMPTHSAHLICLDDQCTISPPQHAQALPQDARFFHWPGFLSAHASDRFPKPAHHSTPRRFLRTRGALSLSWLSVGHAFVRQILSRLLAAVGTADDEYIDSKNRIPVVEGASPVPRGPGLGYEVDESEIRRMSGPTVPVTLWFRLRFGSGYALVPVETRLFGWGKQASVWAAGLARPRCVSRGTSACCGCRQGRRTTGRRTSARTRSLGRRRERASASPRSSGWCGTTHDASLLVSSGSAP